MQKRRDALARREMRALEKRARLVTTRPEKPDMVKLAEMSCDAQDVKKLLMRQAETLVATGLGRKQIVLRLEIFCNEHYFSGFQRRKTIAAVAKRAVAKRYANSQRA